MATAAVAAARKAMQALLPPRFQHGWYLIATAAATAHGLGGDWLPQIYRHAVEGLSMPSTSTARQKAIRDWENDLPRRKIVRQLKEVLIKSTILVGVGDCIEGSLALGSALEECDKDDTMIREDFDTDGKAYDRGKTGLNRVYLHNITAIFQKMDECGAQEFKWLSSCITYGQLLGVIRPDNIAAALTFSETELVVLTALMSRKAHREVLWHLRGCLRSGMSPGEVEQVQQAIEACLEVVDHAVSTRKRHPMPRVSDVRDIDEAL